MRNYKILFLFLFFIVLVNSQTQWPLINPDSQARVIGKVGEVRNSVRLHRGTDINNGTNCANGNCDIYSVNAGVVGWRNGGGNWSQGSSRIEVGDVFYYHCRPSASILSAGAGNTQVDVGDKIGSMIQSGAIHVHLQAPSVNYLNQSLDPYIDNVPPTLTRNTNRFREGYKIYRNGIRRTSTNTNQNNLEISRTVNYLNTNYLVIYSKIDIAVEAEDRGVSQTGGVTGGNSAVFAYEYQLQNFSSPNTSNPLYEYTLAFDEAPDIGANNIVLHPNAYGYGVRDAHIITSHASNTPYDRFFNTAIRKDVTENWANNNNLTANYNGNAQFPDDRYRLYIDAYDVDFNDNPNNRLANRVDVPIIIDNFLPYIEKVEVYNPSNSSNLLYKAGWIYNSTTDILTFTFDTNLTITNSQSQNLLIKVYPSEKFSELKLKLGGSDYNLQEHSSGDYWVVNVNNNSQLNFGLNVLEFEGKDLAGNELLAHPPLLPIKLANGNWPTGAITGTDRWHRIKIGTATGNGLFGADFTTGNSCPINKTNGVNCLEVCFNDSSNSNNSITSWFWEFGDTNSSTSYSRNPSFTYSSPGTYDVTLTITNSSNQTSSITKTITVDDCNSDGDALISSNLTEGEAPQAIEFEDLTVGDIYARKWKILDSSNNDITSSIHFLDGTENDSNIELIFEESGTYRVSLDIEDYYGNVSTSNTITVNISDPPSTELFVDFDWNTPYYTGILTQFNSQVTGGCGNLSYRWKFNDYNGSTQSFFENPQYLFSVPGSYTVELCVTDNCGTEVCLTKEIYISNSDSGIVAKMFSPVKNLDWIVYKGQEISFYDYSEPKENIRSQSWYFDFKSGVSNTPDIYRNYPINQDLPVKHTYNQVGTYKVRLYVGDNNYQWQSFEERTITVVDETDYLEIQNVNQTHRQTLDRSIRKMQTRNFNGNLLALTIPSSNRYNVEIYNKDNQGNYNISSTLLELPYSTVGVNSTKVFISGYEDKVAVFYNEVAEEKYKLKIYRRLDDNWSAFELLQTKEYNYEKVSNSWRGLIHYASIKLYKNTLVVGYHKHDDDNVATLRRYVEVYEFNSSNNLFEYKSNLYDSVRLDGNYNSAINIDVTDETIAINSYDHGGANTPGFGNRTGLSIYKKTENGWVNSIEDTRLHDNLYDYVAQWSIFSGVNNAIGSLSAYGPNISRALSIWEKPTSGWTNNIQTAHLKTYTENYDDLAANYSNKSVDRVVDEMKLDSLASTFLKKELKTDNRYILQPKNYAKISKNGNFIITHGGAVRDYPNGSVICIFYKQGKYWKNKNIEDARLFPLNTTSNEALYNGGHLDENNNIITQIFDNSYSYRESYIYTYDLNNINITGSGICNQSIFIDNQNISTDNLGAVGKDITISNSSFSNQAKVIYKATDRIVIKPNTVIQGSNFRAKIVDCNTIDQ